MGFALVRENRVFPNYIGIYGFYGVNMGFARVKYGVRTGSGEPGFPKPSRIYGFL